MSLVTWVFYDHYYHIVVWVRLIIEQHISYASGFALAKLLVVLI